MFKKFFVFAVMSALVLSGCDLLNKAPEKSPEEMVNLGFQNFYDVRSGEYNIKLTGKAETPEVADTATEGAKDAEPVMKKANFDFALSGVFDFREALTPQGTVKLEGFTQEEGAVAGPQNFGVELRVDKENIYALLSQMPDMGTEVPSEMIDLFLGQWWKMAIPEGVMQSLSIVPKDEKDLTPQEMQVRELAKQTNFFKNLQYLGNERVMGTSTYHYSGELDKEALKTFLVKAAEINSGTVEDAQLQNLEKLLASTEFSTEIWVGKSDMTMRRMLGKTTLLPETGGKLDMNFDVMFGDINKNVKIEIPEDAKEFDPTALMGSDLLQSASGLDQEINNFDSLPSEAPATTETLPTVPAL